MTGGSMDNWRNYFCTANGDIFDIIDHAIMVAALDCPKEFKLRRDRIAEKLFTCKLTRCYGCDRMELAVPAEDGNDDGIGLERDGFVGDVAGTGSKESKVNSCRDDDHVKLHYDDNNMIDDDNNNNNNRIASNYSFGEAEALTDEIEEESRAVGEVLRIKDILLNNEDESDSVLFESLRRLELMALTVDTLKSTEIGKAVNGLRKHGSKQIRGVAKTLIEGWKELVDEWVNATKVVAAAESTPDSVNPSVVDEEEGLPSPPLDEGAFFSTDAGIELSQFFDGMDDFGNPRNSGEFIKKRENGRRASLENQNILKWKLQTPNDSSYQKKTPNDTNVLTKENKSQQMKKQEAFVKHSKSSNANTGPWRPLQQNMRQKVNKESKLQQRSDKVTIQKKPVNTHTQQNKFKCSDEAAVQVKLEATKRKLQERYQEAQNAKRQRTIQVMELHDLPKQGLGRNQNMRPGNHNRHWANGRR